METLRVVFESDYTYCAGFLIAEHINDDSRSLIRVDAEYADADGSDLFWVNNGYLYPENELELEDY